MNVGGAKEKKGQVRVVAAVTKPRRHLLDGIGSNLKKEFEGKHDQPGFGESRRARSSKR